MIQLEVCANSIQSAIEAQKGGALRVELCDNLADGGTTPSLAQIETTRKSIDIQLYTIIRPRGGDFFYSAIEFEIMKRDAHLCGQAGCDGIVIGILNPDGTIDKKRNKELIDIARQYNMGVTFHRAFDRTADLSGAMEDIIALGCERILTSGGKKTALEGKEVIKQLIEKAAGRISIMPGGGITENNIQELVEYTGLKEFHGSFQSQFIGKMEYKTTLIGSEKEEYSYLQTDSNRVKLALQRANNAK
ncbi:copper homeostasis protein CutC [Dysgonomonas sp. 25]|uniref:copper homeostasis protein CutC n=1 Tax=Dysgonomonas sp. 25 TaxID=2302933 RepID=UPI0013D4DB6E|nr:copper homeostasis protein CutC [Dysgonomonas sp. 25]NDV69425.1 copper homeostasis protein CutC [Dysgonomonas sp. 25]